MKKTEQQLISFADNSHEVDVIQNQIDNGWFVSSIYFTGTRYIGKLEKINNNLDEGSIFIPPRKNIKFSF